MRPEVRTRVVNPPILGDSWTVRLRTDAGEDVTYPIQWAPHLTADGEATAGGPMTAQADGLAVRSVVLTSTGLEVSSSDLSSPIPLRRGDVLVHRHTVRLV